MTKQRNISNVAFGAEFHSPTRRSVVAELELLKECCDGSANIGTQLRTKLLECLKSQAGLASLELSDRSIISMSLNTQKCAADSVIVGGFTMLNSYRKAAFENLSKQLATSSLSKRGTIEWYKKKCEEMEAENSALIDDMVVLTARLERVMDYARKLASSANKSKEFLAEQSELLRKFPARWK